MGRKEDFEGEEGQSLLASILATIITLVIVGGVIAVVNFGLFEKGTDFLNSTVASGTSKDISETGSKVESTSKPMDISASNPITEVDKETSASTVQGPNREGGLAESSETMASEEQDGQNAANTAEEQGMTEVSDAQDASDTHREQGMEVPPTVTTEPINIEDGHSFTEVNEAVTAKEATNLRNMPSQGEESKVKVTLYNGQVATRIGISDSGWSKVIYEEKTYYAVSSYLTTDLTSSTPVPEEDGIKTVFTECDEMVAPKIEVNLRTLPSVTNPESVVVVKLPYGTQVRRTGINTDVGWSRVEYEGQVLYCVSSYVFVVEQVTQ